MSENLDPHIINRLEKAKHHHVIESIKIEPPEDEVESNKNLPNIFIEGDFVDFGWSEKAVDNFIDALNNNYIKVERLDNNRIRIEFLPIPIEKLPIQFGHVSELDVIKKNLQSGSIYGSQQIDKYTYLQTPDFAVEGYMDDEEEGKIYGRVYVDTKRLIDKRNVYLDPESLNITDYEYGYGFCVLGGVPFDAITKIDVIKAKKTPYIQPTDDSYSGGWLDEENAEEYINRQTARLREYINKKMVS